MFASTSSGGPPRHRWRRCSQTPTSKQRKAGARLGARGGVQRKAAQTASGEERTSKSVLSCGQFLDKVSIDGMAKPRGKSVKSTVNYIQKSCQLGKNSWGLRSLNRAGLAGRLQFPLQTSPFAVLSIVVSYVLEMPRWALLSCTSSKIMWV